MWKLLLLCSLIGEALGKNYVLIVDDNNLYLMLVAESTTMGTWNCNGTAINGIQYAEL